MKAGALYIRCLIFFICCLFVLPVKTPAQDRGRVTGVTFQADAKRVRGNCWQKINFSGRIATNGAALVRYAFVRSDGSVSQTYTLTFRGAESHSIHYDWSLNHSYRGWVKLRILAPNESETAHSDGDFTLECTN